MVVHGEDGLDEITITGDTIISELKDQHIKRYVIKPEDLGLPRAKIDDLKVNNLQENSEMLRNVLSGVHGPQRNVVLMNTAAVLMAGDKVKTLQHGIAAAKESIDNGLAISKLEQLIQLSQTVAKNQ
jgi:anthranilate phosphoribosyltransferase